MSKLFKLRRWVTLSDAAKYLEGAFTEPVSEADILQLALDGQLKLSVNFINPVEVLLGRLTPKTEIPFVGFVTLHWMTVLD